MKKVLYYVYNNNGEYYKKYSNFEKMTKEMMTSENIKTRSHTYYYQKYRTSLLEEKLIRILVDKIDGLPVHNYISTIKVSKLPLTVLGFEDTKKRFRIYREKRKKIEDKIKKLYIELEEIEI